MSDQSEGLVVPQSGYTGKLGPFLDFVFKARVEFPRRRLGVRGRVPQPCLEVVEGTGDTEPVMGQRGLL